MFNNKKFLLADILVVITSLLYFVAGSLINVNRYWQFDLGYYDFGIFDRAIWLVSRFRPPIIDHFMVPGKLNLADHFNPSIFLFSPLYWITDRSEILLIAQSFIVGIGGIVVYLISNLHINNRFISIGMVLSYFMFNGMQNAVYADFHELTSASTFILLTYYFFFKKYKRLFLTFLF